MQGAAGYGTHLGLYSPERGGEELYTGVRRRGISTMGRMAPSARGARCFTEGGKDLALCLLQAGADGEAGRKGCDGRTILDTGAEGGNRTIVSILLDIGGLEDLDAMLGDKQMTALHRASKGDHVAAARAPAGARKRGREFARLFVTAVPCTTPWNVIASSPAKT